eukprot:Gb_09102 [translate_table: standard]
MICWDDDLYLDITAACQIHWEAYFYSADGCSVNRENRYIGFPAPLAYCFQDYSGDILLFQSELFHLNVHLLSIFLGLYKAFTADDVKIELGGPASAIGGKGATSAKIKATANFLGTPRDVCLSLELFKGRSANDAVGALALDLYEAFFTAAAEFCNSY